MYDSNIVASVNRSQASIVRWTIYIVLMIDDTDIDWTDMHVCCWICVVDSEKEER